MKLNSIQIKSSIAFLIFLALMAQSSMLHARQGNQLNEKKENEAAKIDADYWFNKGAICATYGNDTAAIGYYKKAIKHDPQNDIFYFALGVSFGEIGEYSKAIVYIDKAIDLNPMKGLYYYGRARVWLLSGDKSRAMEDFFLARDLGSIDARKYLKYIGHRYR